MAGGRGARINLLAARSAPTLAGPAHGAPIRLKAVAVPEDATGEHGCDPPLSNSVLTSMTGIRELQFATRRNELEDCHRDHHHRREAHNPNCDPGSPGPAAVVALSLVSRNRAWHGVDPRRPGGDDRRLDRFAA